MGKDNDGEELELTLPKGKIKLLNKIARKDFGTDGANLARFWILDRIYNLSGELKAVKATTSPVPKKGEDPITNRAKMKQIVEQEFHGAFTRQDLVDKVKIKYPEIPDDQISPNDWSVNCRSGKQNNNAFLIRIGTSEYKMRNPSVNDLYEFINGMWYLKPHRPNV